MPSPLGKRKYTAKRSSYKRPYGQAKVVRIPRDQGILGNSIRKSHKFCDYGIINAATGATGTIFFRANSLYDPDAQTGGHQAMAYDQLYALYNHYTVTNVSCSVIFINSSGQRMICAVNIYDTNSVSSDINDICENDGAKFEFIGPDNSAGSTKSQCTITKSVDLARFFGVKKQDMVNASLYRGSNGNPTEQAFFGVTVAEPTGGFDPGNVNVYVVLTYDTVWSEPRKVLGS